MYDTLDYISMAILALIGIAAFLNIKGGTFTEWLKAKFLGEASSSAKTPATPFTPSKAP
ncbi:MAG: hypothetical protein ACYCVN_12370 [Acidimicrobiales bacterium]